MPLTPIRLATAVLVVAALFGSGAAFAGASPTLASAVAVAVAALLVAAFAASLLAVPAAAPRTSAMLRRRVRTAGPVRQHDPDAAGRPRPRAPSAA